MSSRSLAAARARRSGENAPPVSGNRPITSIGSQAAFTQQMPSHMSYNMPPPPNNVRIAKSMQPNQPHFDQNQRQQNHSNGLPFTKLSISDAIGLITLRLGRVEQWIIDTEHENETEKKSENNILPDGYKMIDNATFTTIIHRLDSLEKNGGQSNTSVDIQKIIEDVKMLNDQFTRMVDDVNKHTIELAKNTEQVFRFNRELTETKDILKSFMVKYDMFTQETARNFTDYELALSDLEQRLPMQQELNNILPNDIAEQLDNNLNDIDRENSNMTIDLKNIVKEELSKM